MFLDSAAKIIKNIENLASTSRFFLRIRKILIFRAVRLVLDTDNLPKAYYSHQLIDFCRTFAATNNFKQKNMKKLFLLASLLLAFGISADAGDITSPNGQIKVNFTLDGTVPTYSVTYQGKTIIKPSRLGYQLAKGGKDGKGLLADFSVIDEKTSTFDETWTPVWGENKSIRNHYNDMLVELKQNSTDSYMNVRFRVYDDGVGLRYEFPQKGSLNYFTIKEERTEFAMTGDHTAWWIPGDYDTQEYEYTKTRLSGIHHI